MTETTDPSGQPALTADLCVIGAGAGGLSVAASAAHLGARVILIEENRMGGDCLHHGCVPSKALVAAAKAAAAARQAATFGIVLPPPVIDDQAVLGRMRAVIAGLQPVDSEQRFRALGVTVLKARARFVDARTVEAGGRRIMARRYVIATGGQPVIPDIPGLADGPYLTHATLFDLDRLPGRLAIIGGGAIGCELGQALRRLGVQVAIVDTGPLLANADDDARSAVRRALLADDVALFDTVQSLRIERGEPGGELVIGRAGQTEAWAFDRILVAAGRRPALDGLGLDEAGVTVSARGIVTRGPCRTSNRRVYAIGDCAEGGSSTHGASHQAGVVVRNALFRLPARPAPELVPRVIYTAPEIASVGLSEPEARAAEPACRVLRLPLCEIDRARIDGDRAGIVKALVDRKGRILGATVVAPHAGDLIAPWTLALRQKLRVDDLADVTMPYPTLSDATRRIALIGLAERLRGPWIGRLLRLLRVLG